MLRKLAMRIHCKTLTTVASPSDRIMIKDLKLRSIAGKDMWGKVKPQPIELSLTLKSPVALAGSKDHLPHSIHYGTVTKEVTKYVEATNFESLEALGEGVADLAMSENCGAENVEISVNKPRASLRAEAAGIFLTRGKGMRNENIDVFIRNLRGSTTIGVNPWEREWKQDVLINVTMHDLHKDVRMELTHVTGAILKVSSSVHFILLTF